MSNFINIDPNVGLNTETTVKITLGMWGYRSEHLITLSGNVLGLDVIDGAIDSLEDDIETHKSKTAMFAHQDRCITLTNSDGGTLEIDLDDGSRFSDLVVSAEIVNQIA